MSTISETNPLRVVDPEFRGRLADRGELQLRVRDDRITPVLCLNVHKEGIPCQYEILLTTEQSESVMHSLCFRDYLVLSDGDARIRTFWVGLQKNAKGWKAEIAAIISFALVMRAKVGLAEIWSVENLTILRTAPNATKEMIERVIESARAVTA